MDTDGMAGRLGMIQLSDSMFPTGMFAASWGLEYMASSGQIRGAPDLAGVIHTGMEQQIGPTECIAISHVYGCIGSRDIDGVLEADEILFASRQVGETRDASTRSGIQLARCVTGFSDDAFLAEYSRCISERKTHGMFAVSLAACCSALDIGRDECMTVLLYGYASSMTGAALRLGMIDHFESQRVIHESKPVISRVIRENAGRPISEMWQFCPQLEICQMSHERMDPKMFIT